MLYSSCRSSCSSWRAARSRNDPPPAARSCPRVLAEDYIRTARARALRCGAYAFRRASCSR